MLKSLTKRQKKSNNKGFSLVELIVVIAIMAVLVGVLAPTLIKNVENSRKSKDEQNLDTVQGAIQTMLAEEKYYNVLTTSGTNEVYVDGSTGEVTIKGISSTDDTLNELKTIIGKDEVKLTSKDYKSGTITFTVSTKDGKITRVYSKKSETTTTSKPE